MRTKPIKTENHGPRRRRVLASLMAESPSAAVMVAPTASCLHYQYVGLCLSISYAAFCFKKTTDKLTEWYATLPKRTPPARLQRLPSPPADTGLKYQKDPLAITHVASPPRPPPPLR